MLGFTSVAFVRGTGSLAIVDSTLAGGTGGTAESVNIDNFTFAPTPLSVPKGTRVTWTNKDDIPHTVVDTGGRFKSSVLDTDQTWNFDFREPGTYEYFCSLHPHMTGKVARLLRSLVGRGHVGPHLRGSKWLAEGGLAALSETKDRENHYLEQVVLRHLDSAYSLARWLVGDDQDAEDVVQEASLKALNGLARFKGERGKAWFLAIVRNSSLDRLNQRKRLREEPLEFESDFVDFSGRPGEILLKTFDRESLWSAIDALPVAYREMIVMRELEELSYREIADATSLPIGTVMSRLARARQRLQAQLLTEAP